MYNNKYLSTLCFVLNLSYLEYTRIWKWFYRRKCFTNTNTNTKRSLFTCHKWKIAWSDDRWSPEHGLFYFWSDCIPRYMSGMPLAVFRVQSILEQLPLPVSTMYMCTLWFALLYLAVSPITTEWHTAEISGQSLYAALLHFCSTMFSALIARYNKASDMVHPFTGLHWLHCEIHQVKANNHFSDAAHFLAVCKGWSW